MNQNNFLVKLDEDGFPPPELVVRTQRLHIDLHSHLYEVKGYVIEGQINFNMSGIKHTYISGDIFHLLPNQFHSESIGNMGLKYLVSRKLPSVDEPVIVREFDT